MGRDFYGYVQRRHPQYGWICSGGSDPEIGRDFDVWGMLEAESLYLMESDTDSCKCHLYRMGKTGVYVITLKDLRAVFNNAKGNSAVVVNGLIKNLEGHMRSTDDDDSHSVSDEDIRLVYTIS